MVETYIYIYIQREIEWGGEWQIDTQEQRQSNLSLITNYWNVCKSMFRYYYEKYLRLNSKELIAFAIGTILLWILIKGEGEL